jgi:deoxyribodipyrimidine photo-lyase
VAYFPYLEPEKGASKGLIDALAADAAVVISDEYPVYIIQSLNRYLRAKSPVPFITVDSNGIIPLGITDKAPYSAYTFRRVMQRHFVEAYTLPPKEDPLAELVNREDPLAGWDGHRRWPRGERFFGDPDGFVASLPIDHSVGKLAIRGTRAVGLEVMRIFIDRKLMDYGTDRSHPDLDKASGLSAWLHFGKVSEYEVVKAALERQPKGWSMDAMSPVAGKREGFFGGEPSVESFLDEVITWREVGFHYCHHTPNYDKFESLPDWAIATLEEHAKDVRPVMYTFEQLENSQTHDDVWNAAQRQLREEEAQEEREAANSLKGPMRSISDDTVDL